MEILDGIEQGSEAWHKHRALCWNASDIPAIMGVSPYKSRTEFMREIATGIGDNFDEQTQARFAEGHRSERLARPLMEKIIGRKLFPVVGYTDDFNLSLPLSASFDGLTMDDSEGAEHKSLNNMLREVFANNEPLPELYTSQMEAQCMVSGAVRILFMASKWDGDSLVEELHRWYDSDTSMRYRILQAINQFENDLKTYEPPEYIPAAVAEPIKDLPTVSIQVTGSIAVIDNLTLFGDLLKRFIKDLNMEPDDDQGFADAKAAVASLKKAEDALEAGETYALAQVASIDEMRRTKKELFDTARTTRLLLEKMVKEREVQIRVQVAQKAKDDFTVHILDLNKLIGKHYMPEIKTDFPAAMKNKRTLASLREAVNNELVRAKLEASKIGQDICINMNTLKAMSEGFEFLFKDEDKLVLKDNEALQAIVKNRISEHVAAEAAKKEAERAAMQAAEEAKARAKAQAEQEAILAAERARIAAEERLKAQAEVEAQKKAEAEARFKAQQEAEEQRRIAAETTPLPAVLARTESASIGSSPEGGETSKTPVAEAGPKKIESSVRLIKEYPSSDMLIAVVADHFDVSNEVAFMFLRAAFRDSQWQKVSV